MAANALLKHDTSELSAMLAESREDARLLREEVEELRAIQPGPSPIPGQTRQLALAAELSQSRSSAFHSRTESSPMVGSVADRLGWSRMSTSSSIRSGGWDHARQNSMVPSIASSTGEGGPLSPGLGLGQVGEYGGKVHREDGVISPTIPSGRESPRLGFRASPSGGLGYVVNGIPKKSQRPGPQRTYSVDRRKSYFVSRFHIVTLRGAEYSRVRTPLPKIRPAQRAASQDLNRQLHQGHRTLQRRKPAGNGDLSCSPEGIPCRLASRLTKHCHKTRPRLWSISPLRSRTSPRPCRNQL